MFILDGRKAFYQWDLEQKITSSKFKTGDQIHFTNDDQTTALVLIAYELNGQVVVDVPNILLQSAIPITVYRYIKNNDDAHTIEQQDFYVVPRTKPDDYIYTETEHLTVEKAVEQALIVAKESGDFKGDKGDKGDAGVVKFIPVAELPTENIDESAIYLVPYNAAQNNNTFDEYVYIDERWEKIGSASVEIDLDEYVKNTDYATADKAGVVVINRAWGIEGTNPAGSSKGALRIVPIENSDIDKRASNRALQPKNIDYAVKAAMTDGIGDEWSDEEKASARERIGALSKGYVDDAIAALRNELLGNT